MLSGAKHLSKGRGTIERSLDFARDDKGDGLRDALDPRAAKD
jgi:hypothetical protein